MYLGRVAALLVCLTITGSGQSGSTPQWTAAVSRWPLPSPPTLGKNLIFTGTAEGKLIALNPSTGKVIWSRSLATAALEMDSIDCVAPLGISSRPALSGDNVYVADGAAVIHAFDQATGNEIWTRDLSQSVPGAHISADLLIASGALYAGVASATGQEPVAGAVVRIDLNNPAAAVTLKSFMPAGETGAEVRAALTFDPVLLSVFVATGPAPQEASNQRWGNALLALDPVTLEIRKSYFLPDDRPDYIWSSPPAVFTDASGSRLVALFTRSGDLRVLWAANLNEAYVLPISVGCLCVRCGCGSAAAPAFDSSAMYIGAGSPAIDSPERGTLLAIDFTTGLRWAAVFPGIVNAVSSLPDSNLLVNTSEGVLVVDSGTGAILRTVGDSRPSRLSLSDAGVYLADTAGNLIAFRLPF